jgi:hypothetical protein
MISIPWSIAIVLISAISAIAFPLTTYATTLATFGIAHVAIELRYIDSRFHQQLGGNIEIQLLWLVLSIAILRCCAIFGWIDVRAAHLLELGCGLGLVLLATRNLYRHSWRNGSIGAIIGCLLGIGIIKDPIVTSVIFAIFHNLTPIGFILDRQGFRFKHTRWIWIAIFGLIPLLILLYQYFPIINLPLEKNISYLGAFIAPTWQQSSIAYPLFSAVAFLQCMHYAVVIGLFSQWTPNRSRTLIPWLSTRYFYLLLGVISICTLVAFQHSFTLTRSFYGIVASIHAWIEIPLLLLLLQPIKQKTESIGTQISSER